MATVSTSGVLAEENRRVAVARFAEARNPPTGESVPNSGASARAAILATTGPRQPTAITRKIAVSCEVAAAVAGELVVAETENSGTAPAIATSPPISRPRPSSRGSTLASARARTGAMRAARRLADNTASSAIATLPTRTPAAASRASPTAKSLGAIPWWTSPRASECASCIPGQMPDGRAEQRDERRLPGDHSADLTRRCGNGSQEADLLLTLLDGQRHRARHDEQRDEDADAGEGRSDGDQPGPARLELW